MDGKIGEAGALAQFGVLWNFANHQTTAFSDHARDDGPAYLHRVARSPMTIPSDRPVHMRWIVAKGKNGATISRYDIENHSQKLPRERFAISKLTDVLRDYE